MTSRGERSGGRRALLLAIAFAAAALVEPQPARAQTAPVLAVTSDGVVVDAAQLPGLRPAARLGFRRGDGSTTEIAQGSVVDLRDGRALVSLKAGGSVQAGDVAVACGSVADAGSPSDLRAAIENVKTQLAPSGGGSAEIQTAIATLQSRLDSRDSAVRAGVCDVSGQDQEIATLTAQLQQLLAGAPTPTAGAATPSTGATPPAVAVGTPGAQEASMTASPSQSGVAAGGQTDALGGFADIVKQLFQMFASQGQSAGGQQSGQAPLAADFSSPPSSAAAPADPQPPIGAAPITTAPVTSAPPPVTAGPPAASPGAGSTAGPTPTPGTGTAPTVGSAPPPGGGSAPGNAGTSPPPSKPPVSPPPPGSWWATPRLPGTIILPGAPSGSAGGSGTNGAGPGTAPGLRPPPIVAMPGGGLRPAPGAARFTTVHGIVRGDNGSVVGGALVSVGGRQATTTPQGQFTVAGVPLGHQTLVVSARGYLPGTLALDLSSAEAQSIAVMLRRPAVGAPALVPHVPAGARRGHTEAP